ncbi:hypothetical protein PUN28_017087 [Cardiocondyla obscurior]|uniref:Uncharacterized protein n=1 Tax=Cardiocondyla obscurior TaxID=286306 RepID=A0AAW2EPG5_9HYME
MFASVERPAKLIDRRIHPAHHSGHSERRRRPRRGILHQRSTTRGIHSAHHFGTLRGGGGGGLGEAFCISEAQLVEFTQSTILDTLRGGAGLGIGILLRLSNVSYHRSCLAVTQPLRIETVSRMLFLMNAFEKNI